MEGGAGARTAAPVRGVPVELTREADYGVRLMVEVAAAPGGAPVTVAEVARQQMVPTPFLAKIARRLARAGLLRAGRGKGGMTLARPSDDIDLLQVIEALEGPLRLNRCALDNEACPLTLTCPTHPVWREIEAEVRRRLRAARLQDLAAELLRRRHRSNRSPGEDPAPGAASRPTEVPAAHEAP